MSSVSSNDNTQASRARQKPGLACEECRRRKLRCDRKQPRCGLCASADVACNTTVSRPPRGPKKGHLKALQARIVALETRLVDRQTEFSPGEVKMDLTQEDAVREISSGNEQRQWLGGTPTPSLSQKSRQAFTGASTPESQAGSTTVDFSEMLCADLYEDHLYFDRVHIFAPVLHQQRYFSWANEAEKSRSSVCLQYAMWTLAASLSARFQELAGSLYTQTREMLEAEEQKESTVECIDVKQPQAWILLAIYEMMRTSTRRGWMSAGRAFRLVQLMRLYELDGPSLISRQTPSVSQAEWIETEEKRRTFWTAYCLDRFVSVPKGWPLTLNEQVILTRLPAPELNFQSGHPMLMDLLSERIASTSPPPTRSSFTECIILATVCGRCLTHQQQSMVERVYGDEALQDFWDRHQWLSAILETRVHILAEMYPSPSPLADPMLFFANMVAQATVLFLYQIMKSTAAAIQTHQHSAIVLECEERSLSAAQVVVDLVEALTPFIYFKVHPFTPICLYLCIGFFRLHHQEIQDADASSSSSWPLLNTQFQQVWAALSKLKSVNSLASTCLSLLEAPEGVAEAGSVSAV